MLFRSRDAAELPVPATLGILGTGKDWEGLGGVGSRPFVARCSLSWSEKDTGTGARKLPPDAPELTEVGRVSSVSPSGSSML